MVEKIHISALKSISKNRVRFAPTPMNTKRTSPQNRFFETYTRLEESGVNIRLDETGNILINDFPYTRTEFYKFADHYLKNQQDSDNVSTSFDK